MACIDKNLTEEQVEDRIHDFVNNQMTEAEEISFGKHLCDCKHCDKLTKAYIKFTRGAKLHFSYEELNKAYDEGRWQDVIRWGNKLRWMGSSEEVYPIGDKISKARGAISKSDSITFTQNAMSQYQAGNLEEAVLTFKKALDVYPDNFPAMMMLGKALNQLERFEEALAWLTKAQSYDIDDEALPGVWLDLSVAYYGVGEVNKALEYLEKASPHHQDDAGVLKNLGILYLTTDAAANAELVLEKALSIQPEDVSTRANLALAYIKTEKFGQALPILENLESLLPDDIQTLVNLSYVRYQLKSFEACEDVLVKAKAVSSENIIVLSNLGGVLVINKKAEEGIIELERSLAIVPDDPLVNNNIAVAYDSLGKTAPALHYIEIAKKLAPDNPIIQHNYDIITKAMQGEAVPIVTYH